MGSIAESCLKTESCRSPARLRRKVRLVGCFSITGAFGTFNVAKNDRAIRAISFQVRMKSWTHFGAVFKRAGLVATPARLAAYWGGIDGLNGHRAVRPCDRRRARDERHPEGQSSLQLPQLLLAGRESVGSQSPESNRCMSVLVWLYYCETVSWAPD